MITWEKVTEFCSTAGIQLLLALLVLVAGHFLIKCLLKLIQRGKGILKLDQGVKTFLFSATRVVLNIIVILVAAGVVGIPMTSFITLLASAGVAIGLAVQGALGNFVGGLMILIFHPFRTGDYIETGSQQGFVREINVFYTRIVTGDNRYITLPNGSLTNSVIVNHFPEETRRQSFKFTIAYGSDVKKAQGSVLTAISGIPEIMKDPAPVVFLSAHGDSALELTAVVWSASADFWAVQRSIYERVEERFRLDGIEIPFPQMDIHMKA